jgi:hypothetical protein
MKLDLHLKLVSDGTFGRGDGVAGLIDSEVEYDAATGLPFLRGRTIKGLLAEECANILFALSTHNPPIHSQFESAASFLFGQAGSTLGKDALMHVSNALLPRELREAIAEDVKAYLPDYPPRLTPAEVLESLTAIRRQTAVDEETGAPDTGSLRSLRVVLRETEFVAELDIADIDHEGKTQPNALPLLTACVMSLRRGGTGRNRGRGRLNAWVNDASFTAAQFASLKKLVKEAAQ